MRLPRRWILLCLGAATALAQSELTPETLLLARIKVHMSENLAKLPNYTCTQTIERSRRPAPSNRLELVDTLRIEVALVNHKEMFAWPGAGTFEDRKLQDMVSGGTIGNGNFALHAFSVFLSGGPTYTYAGEEMRGDRRTVRYDYKVPLMLSGYRISIPPREARVAYYGSLWVDKETLDLIRLEVRSNEIPLDLGLAEVSDAIEYGRVLIGDSEFLLPRTSELGMLELLGGESRNRTVFSACRQFSGESFLSFGEPPASDSSAPSRRISETDLPDGLLLEFQLETEIDSRRSFVGDPVSARITRDVKKERIVVVPKGAVVTGRITRLERRSRPYEHFLIGLQFFSLDFGNTRASFRAILEDLGPTMIGLGAAAKRTAVSGFNSTKDGIFEVAARDRVQLPRGFRMTWRTTQPPVKDKQ